MDGYFDAVSALVLLLVALAGGLWVCRRFGFFALGETETGRRVQVVESLALDPRRRLVLIRLDGVEHLLLLGPSGDLLVEPGGMGGGGGARDKEERI